MPQIVAFMQNPWFPMGTNEKHILTYRDNQAFHQKLLLGTMSGRRLEQSFGPEFFKTIWWDNANWRPDWMLSGKMSFDTDHIKRVLTEQDPILIVTYGHFATYGVREVVMTYLYNQIPILDCHHPNARGKGQKDLDDFAEHVKHTLETIMQEQ